VPILVFPGLSVLELRPMYATDRRQTKASLNASAVWGRRHNKLVSVTASSAVKSNTRYSDTARHDLLPT